MKPDNREALSRVHVRLLVEVIAVKTVKTSVTDRDRERRSCVLAEK